MKFVATTVIGLVIFSGVVFAFYSHSGFFLYETNPMQYMPNMHRTKALIPQRAYPFYDNFSGARVPPAGTISRTITPYAYTKETPASDVAKFSNPYPISKEVVLRGKKVFNNVCIVCHGPSGTGDGYIVPPYSKPPSLLSDKIRGYADSQIFHVMTVGQNVMGAYGPVVRESDRWAVIHYIRVMQRAANPTDEDLKLFDQVMSTNADGSKTDVKPEEKKP